MATLVDKLQQAIVSQQAEVDRLAAALTLELPAARAKLTTLQTLLTKATPTIETMLVTLHAAGLKLDD